jgi:hypothetical protein
VASDPDIALEDEDFLSGGMIVRRDRRAGLQADQRGRFAAFLVAPKQKRPSLWRSWA